MLWIDKKRAAQALALISTEYERARAKFPPMSDPHQGYAVLLEEVDELWDEIKANSSNKRMAEEAVQIGAMALAFLAEVCHLGEDE